MLLVNGVDVIPYVEAELNRRFPGREQRRATDPDGLLAAWTVLEQTWAATLERVASMPAGTVDVSVAGEWSFAQTLRHLVMATDVWLRRAILEVDQPYHPIGQIFAGGEEEVDMSVFTTVEPTYDEVLEVRAGRVAMVRDFIATVTPEQLAEKRRNPWAPEREVTVLSCLQVILKEEWEHHRYAVRDLDAIEATRPPSLALPLASSHAVDTLTRTSTPPAGIRATCVSGGSRMVPVSTPSGDFRVWTKRVGNNPDLKVLLLHGGPGATDELYECFDAWFPGAGIEYYYYDQLGSFRSDQPDDPSLWDLARFVDEVEQVRQALGLDAQQLRAARAVVGRAARDGVRRPSPAAPQGPGDLQHDGQRAALQRLRRPTS